MTQKGPEYYDEVYSGDYDGEGYFSLHSEIIKHLPKDKNSTILDLGCGPGLVLKMMSTHGYKDIYGVDFSRVALGKASDRNPELSERLIESDITQVSHALQHLGRKFDCILLVEVLEHIKKDREVIDIWMEFLKPDGFILGSVPNGQKSPEVTESHVRLYTQKSFLTRFDHPGRILNWDFWGTQNYALFKFWKTCPDPVLSFVVPVYDGDHYLTPTLLTLMKQTREDIEIVIVNDGWPNTKALMKWWEKRDARISFYDLPKNHGVVYARNFGNKKAKAPIIAVSDQDDLSVPQRAQWTIEIFEKHPEIDCLYSPYHECNVLGQPLNKIDSQDMNREIFLKGGFTWFHSSAAYRRDDILELPYRSRKGCTDDWVFLDEWTKAGKKFYRTEEVLANCRRIPGGEMQKRRQEMGLPPSFVL